MKRSMIMSLATTAALLTISVGLCAPGPDGVPNEVVILDRRGVSPDVIRRPQGGFVLVILNRLVNREETFTLASPGTNFAGSPAAAPMTTDVQHDYAYRYVELAPGEYQLKLKNHAQLGIKIEIAP